jgi:hypothetical protein
MQRALLWNYFFFCQSQLQEEENSLVDEQNGMIEHAMRSYKNLFGVEPMDNIKLDDRGEGDYKFLPKPITGGGRKPSLLDEQNGMVEHD